LSAYNIEFINEVDSTNTYLKNKVRDGGISSPFCVYAGFQTAGRGQRLKTWVSQPFDNILTSFLVDNLGDVSNLTKLNNAAIQAVVETLEKFGINKMAVKWPNDIYVEDKKIAGILIENVVSEQEIKTAVVGVGINVNQQKFVDIAATSVYNELGIQVNLIEFLQELYNQFYDQITKDEVVLNDFVNANLYKQGDMVTFEVEGNEQSYIVEKVSLAGNLLVSAMANQITLEYHKVKWIK